MSAAGFSRSRRGLGLLVLALLGVCAAAGEVLATWSIVVVNKATGEIGLAQATCIVGPDLQRDLAVVVPGMGAGCVQLSFDTDGRRRQIIWDGLRFRQPPEVIIERLLRLGATSFQFGIADLQGRAAAHSGNGAEWTGHKTGSEGDLAWSVQGNILAGEAVADAAVRALRETPGDLAEKLMTAFLASAAAAGDRRCSCDGSDCPPPDFDLDTGKSAHVGFMIVSRHGEEGGECDASLGCARGGPYYLNLNITPGQRDPPDPVLEMSEQFLAWRETLAGRPDHLKSVTKVADPALPGNGTAATELVVALRDWLEEPAGGDSIALRVEHDVRGAGLASIGAPAALGGGVWSVPLTAGVGAGKDVFRVLVDDGAGEILLYPLPELLLQPTLTARPKSLSASSGGAVQLTLQGPAASGKASGRRYLVLGSMSGTEPGIRIGGLSVPVNYDDFLLLSFLRRNTASFVQTEGQLDAVGNGKARFFAPPGALGPLVGGELAFAFLTPDEYDFASNPVFVTIHP